MAILCMKCLFLRAHLWPCIPVQQACSAGCHAQHDAQAGALPSAALPLCAMPASSVTAVFHAATAAAAAWATATLLCFVSFLSFLPA